MKVPPHDPEAVGPEVPPEAVRSSGLEATVLTLKPMVFSAATGLFHHFLFYVGLRVLLRDPLHLRTTHPRRRKPFLHDFLCRIPLRVADGQSRSLRGRGPTPGDVRKGKPSARKGLQRRRKVPSREPTESGFLRMSAHSTVHHVTPRRGGTGSATDSVERTPRKHETCSPGG